MPPTSSFCHRKVYFPIIPSCNRHWNSPNDDEFSKNKTIFCLRRRITVQTLNRIRNVWQISFAFNRRKNPLAFPFVGFMIYSNSFPKWRNEQLLYDKMLRLGRNYTSAHFRMHLVVTGKFTINIHQTFKCNKKWNKKRENQKQKISECKWGFPQGSYICVGLCK